MKFNSVILGYCLRCYSEDNLRAYLYEYNGNFNADIHAYCNDKKCSASASKLAHSVMSIEEAKLYVIKERL